MAQQTVTAERIEHAIRTFNEEAELAVGDLKAKPARFYEFRISGALKKSANEALAHAEAGNYEEALEALQKVTSDLHHAQRSYCARSVEMRFDPMIARLPHIDEDALKVLAAQRDEFAKTAELIGKGKGDLNAAGKAFWALRDALIRAPREQAQRETARAEMKQLNGGKLKGKDKKLDEATMAAQQRVRETRRVEAQRFTPMAEGLRALMR